jgi:hypothetical protein
MVPYRCSEFIFVIYPFITSSILHMNVYYGITGMSTLLSMRCFIEMEHCVEYLLLGHRYIFVPSVILQLFASPSRQCPALNADGLIESVSLTVLHLNKKMGFRSVGSDIAIIIYYTVVNLFGVLRVALYPLFLLHMNPVIYSCLHQGCI